VGLIVVDAGILIAVLDGRDRRHAAAVAALQAARNQADELVLSAAAYYEVLLAPARGGREKIATVDQFLDAVPVRIEPVSREIAARAAVLRARGAGDGMSGALTAATADQLRAEDVMTAASTPTRVGRRAP
jgi:predicted nucleic acid-binding protein